MTTAAPAAVPAIVLMRRAYDDARTGRVAIRADVDHSRTPTAGHPALSSACLVAVGSDRCAMYTHVEAFRRRPHRSNELSDHQGLANRCRGGPPRGRRRERRTRVRRTEADSERPWRLLRLRRRSHRGAQAGAGLEGVSSDGASGFVEPARRAWARGSARAAGSGRIAGPG